MGVNNATGILKKVLMSFPLYLKPEPINVISKKYQMQKLNSKKIAQEFKNLVSIYQKEGVEVVFLEPNKEYPDSVFARDFGANIKEGYILGRFKWEYRQNERIAYRQRMKELGVPLAVQVDEGYFEGGDFFQLDEHTLVIGSLERTNRDGIEELQSKLGDLGYTIIVAKNKPEFLHLDMCFNLVDDHLALICKSGFSNQFLQELEKRNIQLIEVEEKDVFEHGCNVQSLGGKRVIALAKNHHINQKLVDLGYRVIEIDINEILKGGGGIHCMTFPLERI